MGFFEAVESGQVGFWICFALATVMFLLFLGSYAFRTLCWGLLIVASVVLAPAIGRRFGYSPAATCIMLSGAVSSAFIWWDLYARVSHIERLVSTSRQHRA